MLLLETINRKLGQWSFTTKDQQAFLDDVASLVEDGTPINQAVRVLSQLTEGTPALVAKSILSKLGQGKLFADGLEGWFPDTVVEIVRAGEEGGALGKTLKIAAGSLTQKSDVIISLLNSLTYPLVVVLMACGVAVFINHSVLKAFAEIKPVTMWPVMAQNATTIANIIQYWWWAFIIIIVGIIVGFAKFLTLYVGQGRKMIDKLPVFSLYRQFKAARFMETLGLLISNGIVMKKALKILQRNAPPYLKMHLMTMEYRLGGGKENIAEVLETGLIAKEDLVRLRVIAKSKGFEHALLRQGKRAGEQSLSKVRATGRVFGGVLLAAGAGFAAFLILSVYSVGSILAS